MSLRRTKEQDVSTDRFFVEESARLDYSVLASAQVQYRNAMLPSAELQYVVVFYC